MEFHDHLWNHHDKCIQKSTNMHGIDSLFREIDVNISEVWESKQPKKEESFDDVILYPLYCPQYTAKLL